MLRRCHPVTLGLVSGSGEGARRGGDRMNVYGAGECLLANCGGMEGGAVGCQTEVNYLRTGLVIAGWVSTSFSFLYFFFCFCIWAVVFAVVYFGGWYGVELFLLGISLLLIILIVIFVVYRIWLNSRC